MNAKQKRFVEYYIIHWDGIRALQQAGYDTHNHTSAKAQLRRMLEREDVKAVIDEAVRTATPAELEGMDDKEAMIAYCIKQIKENSRHSATFMTNLLKLKGWDKGDQEDADAKPPTFSRMPFKPVENASD